MTVHLLLVTVGKLDNEVGTVFIILTNFGDGGSHMIPPGGIVEDRIPHVKLGSLDEGSAGIVGILFLDLGGFGYSRSASSESLGDQGTHGKIRFGLFFLSSVF